MHNPVVVRDGLSSAGCRNFEKRIQDEIAFPYYERNTV